MNRSIRVDGSFAVSLGQYVPRLGHPVIILVNVSGEPAVNGTRRHEAFAFFTEGDDFHGQRIQAPRETVDALGSDPVPALALGSAEAALRHVMLEMYSADRGPRLSQPARNGRPGSVARVALALQAIAATLSPASTR